MRASRKETKQSFIEIIESDFGKGDWGFGVGFCYQLKGNQY